MDILHGQMAAMMAAIQELKASSTTAPAPPSIAAATAAAAAAASKIAAKANAEATRLAAEASAVSSFVPPISTNPATGASSSLRSLFPDVKAACITSIIMHKFHATDLYKLDSRHCDQESSYAFNRAKNQFEVSNHAAKDYKMPNSVIILLHTYFAILSAHIPNQHTVPLIFFQYLSHLQELASEYEWATVFTYHSIFFNCQQAEMMAGNYLEWANQDTVLFSKHIL
ncbi:hypothetical protein DXG03_008886 [Asterophora parasitica]|uniref:Uncharacterized protein n=1 Tax=Asterophora parasitica TaxID=117018 RepID=A0A9P7FYG7_9AGAR|nr:hypothetical protein DXG03_008886 [Asterophora parasitica]